MVRIYFNGILPVLLCLVYRQLFLTKYAFACMFAHILFNYIRISSKHLEMMVDYSISSCNDNK